MVVLVVVLLYGCALLYPPCLPLYSLVPLYPHRPVVPVVPVVSSPTYLWFSSSDGPVVPWFRSVSYYTWGAYVPTYPPTCLTLPVFFLRFPFPSISPHISICTFCTSSLHFYIYTRLLFASPPRTRTYTNNSISTHRHSHIHTHRQIHPRIYSPGFSNSILCTTFFAFRFVE